MSDNKKRLANFELLRIVAMMMVIALHYISRGLAVEKLSVDNSLSNCLWWFILAVCNVAVNAYVLISGYFLVDSEWKIKKLVKLIVQVLCYSWIVGFVAAFFQNQPLTFDNILTILLPVEYEHYWFATAYIVMYMLAPVLAAGIKQLSQKQLKTVIIALLCFFCIPKSINPYQIPTDSYGYDFGWFICLFLIAGYIKLYGIKLFSTKRKSIICYILGVVLNFTIALACSVIVRMTGKMEYYMDMTYAYNFILVLFSSIAFFYMFTYIKVSDKLSKTICSVAPLTFGTYLLHENIVIRDIWPITLGVSRVEGNVMYFLHMLASIVVIFAAGCLVDALRKVIFDLVEKAFIRRK